MTTSETDRVQALAEAVKSVWRAALPAEPFELDMTWRDAGVDSLKGLEIALRIERETGTPAPFDLMTQDVTIRQFLRLLARQGSGAGPLGDPVFLVPGAFGDGPGQAEFRAALAGQARIVILPLPDIDAPTSVLARLEDTAAGVVAEIDRLQPAGEVRLIGYSYGGYVAQEAARLLEAAGRRVGFLGVLDSDVRQPRARMDAILERDASAERPGFSQGLDLLLHKALCRLGAWEIARRRVLAMDGSADWRRREASRRILLRHVRSFSVIRRPLRACAAPTLLVTSDEFDRVRALPKWRSACPDLKVVPISGGHVAMFRPPMLGELTALILEGLQWAASRRPPEPA